MTSASPDLPEDLVNLCGPCPRRAGRSPRWPATSTAAAGAGGPGCGISSTSPQGYHTAPACKVCDSAAPSEPGRKSSRPRIRCLAGRYTAGQNPRPKIGALAAGTTTWILIGRENVAADHLIRSHRQRPATTCNLSMDGSHPRVQVRGRSWSYVAVDVPIDVGEAARRLSALAERVSAYRAPNSGSGASK
jgi:hypothetical protein